VHFLLDTNVLIPAEPTSSEDIEFTTAAAVDLLNVLSQGRHGVFVHPASLTELAGDRNTERARVRELLLRKYTKLQPAPPLSVRLVAALGSPRPESNSAVDLLLLSVVDADAVDYLVTEDDGIHRKARRVGLGDRVLTLADALVTVRSLFPTLPEPPPLVSSLLAYQLKESDPIFGSFRSDYPNFDAWLARCKREQRRAWVIEVGPAYAGVCIVKEETPNEYGLAGRILKICSLKIADQFHGYRYGELLLKTIFRYMVENRYAGVFVEVFAKHDALLSLLGDFGFMDVRESAKGERVLFKELAATADEAHHMGALDFNRKYGPHAISLVGANAFVVPIRPKYHRLLFPDLEAQLMLATESNPFGNSIRKAYLSHSKIRKVAPGDLLLFYRSMEAQGVSAIGVAEESLVSSDARQVARFVGKRTVYSYGQIEEMAAKPILALLFRLARTLAPSGWNLDLLKRAGIVRAPPQSFVQVPEGAVNWIATQLAAPH
jgi:hypothetical protein